MGELDHEGILATFSSMKPIWDITTSENCNIRSQIHKGGPSGSPQVVTGWERSIWACGHLMERHSTFHTGSAEPRGSGGETHRLPFQLVAICLSDNCQMGRRDWNGDQTLSKRGFLGKQHWRRLVIWHSNALEVFTWNICIRLKEKTDTFLDENVWRVLDTKWLVLPAENRLNWFLSVLIPFKLPAQIKDSIAFF